MDEMSWAYLASVSSAHSPWASPWRPARRQPFGVARLRPRCGSRASCPSTSRWSVSRSPSLFAAFGALVVLAGPGRSRGRGRVVGGPRVARRRRQAGAAPVVDAALDDVLDGSWVGPPATRGPALPRASSNLDEPGGGSCWSVPYRPSDVAQDPQPRLLGRRRRSATGSTSSPGGSPPPERAPVLVYIHGGGVGHRRQARAGHPDAPRAGPARLGVRDAQLPAEPEGDLAGPHVDCKRAIGVGRGPTSPSTAAIPGFIAVSGGSAGGHLCSLLAPDPRRAEWQPGFEDEDTSVDACLPFYGVYDLTGDPGGMGIYGPGLLRFLEKQVMKVSARRPPRGRSSRPRPTAG